MVILLIGVICILLTIISGKLRNKDNFLDYSKHSLSELERELLKLQDTFNGAKLMEIKRYINAHIKKHNIDLNTRFDLFDLEQDLETLKKELKHHENIMDHNNHDHIKIYQNMYDNIIKKETELNEIIPLKKAYEKHLKDLFN